MAKVKLHAIPLTSAGVSVLAVHSRWGLPPVYSVKAILAATPGATLRDAVEYDGPVMTPVWEVT